MTTFTGGCHCKKVRYEVDMELEGAISCNCSICSKRGWLLAFAPISAFRLISGDDELTEYQFNTKKIKHLFCKTCGVASFGKGTDGSGNEVVSINILCLDDIDLSSVPVTQYDGESV